MPTQVFPKNVSRAASELFASYSKHLHMCLESFLLAAATMTKNGAGKNLFAACRQDAAVSKLLRYHAQTDI